MGRFGQLLQGALRTLGTGRGERERQATAKPSAEREPWQRYERLLAALTDCAGLDGLEFYAQLACTLAGGFEARYALVAVLEGDGEAHLRTLAVWSDGRRAEDSTFALAGTPGQRVVAGGTFFCPRGAAALFPADRRLADLGIESYLGKPLVSASGKVMGVVELLDDRPRERSAELESALDVFAGRAAARLEAERLVFEAQAARAEAEGASRAKDAFLATVSHELRNPLNTIVSWAHLLRVGHLEPEEVKVGVDAIERSARQQAQVLEQLLAARPAEEGRRSVEQTSSTANEPPSGLLSPSRLLSGVRALVVEDDREALAALLQLLRSYGAEAQGASTASDALAVFAGFKPAVLVSDIELPGPSGTELLERLRALPPEAGGQIPAVALTATVGEKSRRRVLGAGFRAHLTKPVEPFALVNLIAELAREHA